MDRGLKRIILAILRANCGGKGGSPVGDFEGI